MLRKLDVSTSYSVSKALLDAARLMQVIPSISRDTKISIGAANRLPSIGQFDDMVKYSCQSKRILAMHG